MRIHSLFLFALLMMGNLVAHPLPLSTRQERLKAGPFLLALLYANTYLHELGHKYTAKYLTGTESTIGLGIFAGYTKFDEKNWKILKKNPKAAIITFLAGPAVGFLAGFGVYASAFLFDKNSYLHLLLEESGFEQMIGNLLNLISFYWGNLRSDGYQIWQTYDEMKKEDPEKLKKLENLSQKISPTDQISTLQKIMKEKANQQLSSVKKNNKEKATQR
jgi:peptidase M50-like protein